MYTYEEFQYLHPADQRKIVREECHQDWVPRLLHDPEVHTCKEEDWYGNWWVFLDWYHTIPEEQVPTVTLPENMRVLDFDGMLFSLHLRTMSPRAALALLDRMVPEMVFDVMHYIYRLEHWEEAKKMLLMPEPFCTLAEDGLRKTGCGYHELVWLRATAD